MGSEGYYGLYTPTSTVGFKFNFPESYHVWITELEGATTYTKLATSTFSDLDTNGDYKFTVQNFDSASADIYYINAYVSNADLDPVINVSFPVKGLGEGAVEQGPFYEQLGGILRGWLLDLVIPSPSQFHSLQDKYDSLFRSKVPFSYFYDIKDSFASTTAGVATSAPAFMFTVGGETISFDPINAPAELTITQGWQTFYTFCRYAIYAMFAVYIIGRVKDITTEGSD